MIIRFKNVFRQNPLVSQRLADAVKTTKAAAVKAANAALDAKRAAETTKAADTIA